MWLAGDAGTPGADGNTVTPDTSFIACLLGAPAVVIVATMGRMRTGRVRLLAIGCALVMVAASGAGFLLPELQQVAVPWPRPLPHVFGARSLRVDTLSAALLPLPGVLWLLTVAATPRARLGRVGLARTAASTLATTLCFLTDSPALLMLCWLASTVLFLAALSTPQARESRVVASVYLLSATLLAVVGIALAFGDPAATTGRNSLGLWLVIAAVLIRKGIFPFHAWIPDAFDRGRLGPALLFSGPQLGSYVAAVLLLPRATPEMLRTVAILALSTSVYGAALAAYQNDARRACGYLFVSQSALVLAGLDSSSKDGLAGSLIVWLSSAAAFGGIGRCVLVLEARRGRLDLSDYHGGYEHMPLLALGFLVFGLACAGFPGTLGFVGTELLVEGAVGAFPLLGFAVVAATGLTGFAVLRMYFSLFCGRRSRGVPMPLRRREAIAFGSLATVLLLTGLVPTPVLSTVLRASRTLYVDSSTRGP